MNSLLSKICVLILELSLVSLYFVLMRRSYAQFFIVYHLLNPPIKNKTAPVAKRYFYSMERFI